MKYIYKNKQIYPKLKPSEYFDYDKFGNLIIKTKGINYRKYSPPCKIFSPAEIQNYINSKTKPV